MAPKLQGNKKIIYYWINNNIERETIDLVISVYQFIVRM